MSSNRHPDHPYGCSESSVPLFLISVPLFLMALPLFRLRPQVGVCSETDDGRGRGDSHRCVYRGRLSHICVQNGLAPPTSVAELRLSCHIGNRSLLAASTLHTDWDSARPSRVCTTTGLAPATYAQQVKEAGLGSPCQTCTGPGLLTSASSAPGTGSSLPCVAWTPASSSLGSFHICTGT